MIHIYTGLSLITPTHILVSLLKICFGTNHGVGKSEGFLSLVDAFFPAPPLYHRLVYFHNKREKTKIFLEKFFKTLYSLI